MRNPMAPTTTTGWRRRAASALSCVLFFLFFFCETHATRYHQLQHHRSREEERGGGLYPGTKAEPFTVETINGTFSYDEATSDQTPLIVYAYDVKSGMSEA